MINVKDLSYYHAVEVVYQNHLTNSLDFALHLIETSSNPTEIQFSERSVPGFTYQTEHRVRIVQILHKEYNKRKILYDELRPYENNDCATTNVHLCKGTFLSVKINIDNFSTILAIQKQCKQLIDMQIKKGSMILSQKRISLCRKRKREYLKEVDTKLKELDSWAEYELERHKENKSNLEESLKKFKHLQSFELP